jgi:hypothetical protein
MPLQRVLENTARFISRFFVGEGAEIRCEPAEQSFLNPGMKLALQVRPVDIIAGDDQGFKLLPFFGKLQEFGGTEIVAADLVIGVALQVARVVAEISVATSVARHGIQHRALFDDPIKLYFEKTRRLTVD